MVWYYAPRTGKPPVDPTICDTCFCTVDKTMFQLHIQWHAKLAKAVNARV